MEKIEIFEKIPRSIAKVITWRLLVTVTNFFIGWIASGDPWTGLKIMGMLLVVNSIVFFFHERFWNRIDWARQANTVDKS
jgi:uncharacterized membrane protein